MGGPGSWFIGVVEADEGAEEDDEDVVDELDVYMTDPDEEQMVKIEQVKTKFEPHVTELETL